MEKPALYFYTNMPTPYQLDFFDALADYFRLTVVYFSAREKDRQWQLPSGSSKYDIILLKNNLIARTVQRYISSFHFSNRIIKVAKNANAAMVVVNGTYWSPNVLLALFFSKSKGIKTAYWGEPVFPSYSKAKKAIKQILLSAMFRNTDVLLAIGKRAVECYRAYGYSKPVYNIPYNINAGLFDLHSLDMNVLLQLKNKYKKEGQLIFLSSGSLIYRKGMDVLIRAFSSLPASLNARLLIIGDGTDKDKLIALAAPDKRIEFLGFQEKNMIPYWFNLADIFLFASRYDGWALVINEAMAARKAIVCSNQTGAAYNSLVHRQNALLYDAEDIAGFAAGILELAGDDKFRDSLAENAYQTGTGLSSSNMAKKMYELYRLDQ